MVLQVRASAQTWGHSSAFHDPLGGSGVTPSPPACPVASGTGPGPLRLPGRVVVRDHLLGLLSSPAPSAERNPLKQGAFLKAGRSPWGRPWGVLLTVCVPTTRPQSPMGSDSGGAGPKPRASDTLSLRTAGAGLGFQAVICFIGGL